MPEQLLVRPGGDGKFYLVDPQTMKSVLPKYDFERTSYDSNEEAIAVARKRIAIGYEEQPGLGGLGPAAVPGARGLQQGPIQP